MTDPSVPPPLPGPQAYPTIGGITRTMDESKEGQSSSIQASVRGQAASWMLFVLALLPPLALVLIDGLSGTGKVILYSALWPWGAVVLGIVLVARAGLAAATSQRASGMTALAGPAVLLFAGIVILFLRLRLYPAPLALGLAQVVVYAVCAFALLLAPTGIDRP